MFSLQKLQIQDQSAHIVERSGWRISCSLERGVSTPSGGLNMGAEIATHRNRKSTRKEPYIKHKSETEMENIEAEQLATTKQYIKHIIYDSAVFGS